MMRLILTTIILTMLAQPVWAHQCIPDGSTAEAIQSYNLCKADLANGSANHQADQSQSLRSPRFKYGKITWGEHFNHVVCTSWIKELV